MVLAALPGHFSTDDMKTLAKTVDKSLRTVRRQVARAAEAGEVVQVKHGEYKKLLPLRGAPGESSGGLAGIATKVRYFC